MGAIVASLSPSSADDLTTAARMLAASPHRGSCTKTVLDGVCALGISWGEDIPDAWLAVEEGLAVALTGRVDNIAAIAAMARPDGMWTTDDPARMLLAVFRALGEQAVRRLRGAYAAVITDGRSLWAFRDHLGFAPLFYRDGGAGLHIATEAKQVVAGAQIRLEPDIQVVERIFYETYEDDGACALRGVRRLPKATILVGNPGNIRISRYWHPEVLVETARFAPDELRSRFHEVMGRAVARTLTGSDIVALSGGIDSPTIAAFAVADERSRTGGSIAGLAAVFPDLPSVDESAYIEIVAKDLAMPLHTYRPKARPLDGLERWVSLADAPFPVTSAAEAHELYALARDLGYRNVLTGELAEFVIAMSGHLVAHLVRHRRLGALRRRLKMQRDAGIPFRRIARQLVASVAPDSIRALYRHTRRTPRRFPDWIDAARARGRFNDTPIPQGSRWREAQLAALRGPDLSLEADEVNQAFTGVRVRRPWADVDLWEFFLSLPAEVKFPDLRNKGLVRALLRGTVPDAILDRRAKTYFDEHAMNRTDYRELRRWLIHPEITISGVDYGRLAHHLENANLDLAGFVWAKDLATAHAFLARWSSHDRTERVLPG